MTKSKPPTTSKVFLASKDKLTLISNLATMLTASIPIVEAIDTLMEESKGNMRKVLGVLRVSLNEGHPLSHGMERLPRAFDPVTINLVKAAEEAGTLETTLKELTKSIKKDMAFKEQLRSSLAYPIFVVIIFIGVLTFILAFVVPRLSRVFSGLRSELPAATKFLIAASDFLLNNFIFIIIGALLFVAFVIWLAKTRQRTIARFLLGLPGLKRLGREIDLANFTRSMGMMLGAGIPITEALTFAETVVTKKEIVKMIQNMKEGVMAGRPMSEGLRNSHHAVPQIMVRITETAELSGTLEATMKELAEYFETQVRRTLRTLTTLLEPAMLVGMGLMVGGMMMAVIAPIYGLIGQINAR